MFLVVTIDTEEDNWGDHAGQSCTLGNIERIPRLQRVFQDRGARPTYLITHPVATSRAGTEILGRYRDEGVCEIGSHPHPWNTPPVEEERTVFNSYISHLPAALQYRKLQVLRDTIAARFGIRPTSYRSGKWGFSDDVARNLVRLGYTVDSSISPTWDWSPFGGHDFSSHLHEPFVYRLGPSAGEAGGSLLEVPASIGFLQGRQALANSCFWSIKRRLPLGGRVAGLLSRLGVLNQVCVSPETHDAPRMIRLSRTLLDGGARVINMFFHSPSLLAGCSPFVKTEGEVDRFIARIDAVLAFAQSAGLRFATLSELRAGEIGATGVRRLPASPSKGSRAGAGLDEVRDGITRSSATVDLGRRGGRPGTPSAPVSWRHEPCSAAYMRYDRPGANPGGQSS